MISIVSPLYNKGKQVEFFLASLFRQTYKGDFEVVLVDDVSTDDTLSVVARTLRKKPARISVKIIRNESNQGNCTSRNTGIQESSGDIVIVTDADCMFSKNFIDEYLRTYMETQVHIVVSNFGIELGRRNPLRTLDAYESSPKDVRADRKIQDPAHPDSFLNTVTRGFSFRRSSLPLGEPIYDENFNYRNSQDSGFGWEDIDVGCRAHELGLKVAFAEKAFTIHVTHPPSTDTANKPLKLLKNYRLLHQKHPWLRDAKSEWSIGKYEKILSGQTRAGIAMNDDNHALERHLYASDAKNEIVVYTAIFGNKDRLREPVAFADVDYVCFTDDATMTSDVWKIVYVPANGTNPRKQAKEYKILPHKFFPEHTHSIWVDGTHVPTVSPHRMIGMFLRDKPLALFKHHKRVCAYDEAAECIALGLDAKDVIERQVEEYRGSGYPERAGLSTCTVIFRSHNDAKVVKAMERWWREICAHSIRDQISFDYVMYMETLPFLQIHENVYSNRYFARHYHADAPKNRPRGKRTKFERTMLARTHRLLGIIGPRLLKTSPMAYRCLKSFLSKIPLLSSHPKN